MESISRERSLTPLARAEKALDWAKRVEKAVVEKKYYFHIPRCLDKHIADQMKKWDVILLHHELDQFLLSIDWKTLLDTSPLLHKRKEFPFSQAEVHPVLSQDFDNPFTFRELFKEIHLHIDRKRVLLADHMGVPSHFSQESMFSDIIFTIVLRVSEDPRSHSFLNDPPQITISIEAVSKAN